MKFPRSYMSNCMGAWFFRWGLPPHTLIMNRLPLRLKSKTLSNPVRRGRFHLPARCRKKLPKAEGQRLAVTVHIVGCRHIFIAVFLFPYCHIGAFLYSCIYIYTNIHLCGLPCRPYSGTSLFRLLPWHGLQPSSTIVFETSALPP